MANIERQRYLDYQAKFYLYEGSVPVSIGAIVDHMFFEITAIIPNVIDVDQTDMLELAAFIAYAQRKNLSEDLEVLLKRLSMVHRALSTDNVSRSKFDQVMEQLSVLLGRYDAYQISLIPAELNARNDQDVLELEKSRRSR